MNKLNIFLKKHHKKIIWLSIGIYSLIFSIICIWKYNHFLYNGLDLAIINNVFYNSLHGHWFWSSIQGHNYLGDHFTPILILLLPLYTLWQSPEILLILQSIFLGLAAWPIYLISQIILKNNKLALGLSLLWLINPLIHNINLFEFHFIALAPFSMLMLFYFYLKLKKERSRKIYLYFYLFIWINLLIREDITFIILTFLIIILLDNLKNKYILRLAGYSLLIALSWLIITTKLIAHFSPSNSSPFIYYYQWLLSAGPGQILKHIFSLYNFEMLVGLLLPFLFIPLIKPKWLLLTAIPLTQIIFSATGGGALIWEMHYVALFLPALIISFIYGFKSTNHYVYQQFKSHSLLIIILLISNLYLWMGLGPLTPKISQAANQNNLVQSLIQALPASSSVLSSYNFLANLSSRQEIYALNYYFLDQQQFASAKYQLDELPTYILINFQDLIDFSVQFPHLAWTKTNYNQGYKRLRKLLTAYGVVKVINQTVLFKKDYDSDISLLSHKQQIINKSQLSNKNKNRIELIRHNFRIIDKQLQLGLSFQKKRSVNLDYQLMLELNDGLNKYKKILPMAYGLYPTSQWQKNDIININYWLNWPTKLNIKQTKIKLSLVKLKGGLEMDKFGMTKLVIDEIEPLTSWALKN